jgi:hypothetical protein
MTITSKATPRSFTWLASLSPSDTYETASSHYPPKALVAIKK